MLASLATAAVALACIDITVNKDALGSIEVVNKGTPAIAAGDTLRDSAGNVAPLGVIVYNAGGEPISTGNVKFVATDTMDTSKTGGKRQSRVTVSTEGIVVARAGVTGTAKIYAVAEGRLQSALQSIEVVPKPESLATSSAARDTINYRTLAANPYDTSGAFAVRVAGPVALNVSKWLVNFSLLHAIDDTPVTDTSLYAIVTDEGRISTVDTTDASGIASRRVRFRGIPGTTLTDSVYLVASARLGKTQLPGSPKRLFVLVKLAAPTP
ncbi:MAG: hypothetical protein ABIT38_14925 [Gemmatimonadaceae bacterium]